LIRRPALAFRAAIVFPRSPHLSTVREMQSAAVNPPKGNRLCIDVLTSNRESKVLAYDRRKQKQMHPCHRAPWLCKGSAAQSHTKQIRAGILVYVPDYVALSHCVSLWLSLASRLAQAGTKREPGRSGRAQEDD